MKTSVIEVHDMLSVLSLDEVEKRIGEVPGVESATVNYAAGSATVRYDETRLHVADIKSGVRQRGFATAANNGTVQQDKPVPAPDPKEETPGTVAASPAETAKPKEPKPNSASKPPQPPDKPEDPKSDAETPPTSSVETPPDDKAKSETQPPAADAKAEDHKGHKPDEVSQDKAAMVAEMGHGSGEDMDALVSDMRNRFLVTLVLSFGVFLYAPMFVKVIGTAMPTPFGISTEQTGLMFTTPAVL